MEKIKLLIVDDELEILKALKRLLIKNYHVDIFTCGKDAITALHENVYPVIISDMRMPIMDGAEFLAKAHDLSPTSQKILLTGFSDPTDTSRAVNQGHINFYLNKPWQNDHLESVILEAVNAFYQDVKRRSAFYNIKLKNQQLAKNTSELEVDLNDHETALNRAEHRNEIALSKIKQTLQRSVDTMGHCIDLHDPTLIGHGERLSSFIRHLGQQSELTVVQISHLCIAARLYRLGLLSIPTDVLACSFNQQTSGQQADVIDALVITCELLTPFIELTASIDIIQLLHNLCKEPSQQISNADAGLLFCAKTLFICSKLDLLMAGRVTGRTMSFNDAVEHIEGNHHYIDKTILMSVIKTRKTIIEEKTVNVELALTVNELTVGLELTQHVVNLTTGQHYLQRPHILTAENVNGLQKISANQDSPIIVYAKY